MRLLPALLLLALPATSFAQADKPDAKKLTEQALAILKTHCYRCHGLDGSNEGGLAYILDVKQLIARRKIVPGDSKKSRLYARLAEGDMPPEGEKLRPSKAEVTTLKSWIEVLGKSGVPSVPTVEPAEKPRSYVSTLDNWKAIRDHLRRVPEPQRRFQRYFTFTHQHNNPKISERDLRQHHAALAKLLNSLSWRPAIVVPFPVDAARTVWVVDIRKLDWVRHGLWRKVLNSYPYGLRHDRQPRGSGFRQAAREVREASGTWLPLVRADWFISTASRPPLYHDLLRLPDTAGELEKQLKVDVIANFRGNRLARAGFTESGVSRSNRLVERHEAAYGAYWKSYDFKTSDGRGNLFALPLGPAFKGNEDPQRVFLHDGGEIIFNLPNGLQGYLLVDGKDRRIDAGPTEVVRDKDETSGTVAVVNGLSCIFCHQHGMKKEFTDGVRQGTRVRGQALDKVRRLYPPAAAMNKLMDADEKRFLSALDRAMGAFLKVGPDANKDIKEFKEVVGPIARRYLLAEVSVADACLELGVKEKAMVETAIKASDELRRLGLLPLAQGRSVKREVWESRKGLISPFQQTAHKLELGTPLVVAPARSRNSPAKEAPSIAEDVKKFLDVRGDKQIAVGRFPGQQRSAKEKDAPTFSKALTGELRKLKIEVVAKSKLTIQGVFRSGPLSLTARIVDVDGNEVAVIERN
jgi:serine/threonine-protein kinase